MGSILEPLVAQVMAETLRQASRRSTRAEVLLLLAAMLLGMAGVVFGILALYWGLAEHFSAPKAALIAAGVVLLLAGMAASTAALIARRRKIRPPHYIPEVAQALETSLVEIGRELEEPIRDNPGTALLLAGLAGFLSGKRLH